MTAINYDDDFPSLDFMALTSDTGDIEVHLLKSVGNFSKLDGAKKLLKEFEN